MVAVALTAVMAWGPQAQPPVRDARPSAAGGTATVRGVVVSADAQARPLRRARVTLNGPGLAMGRTAITADDGSFVFDRLPAGRFTLGGFKDGYVPMNYGATRPERPGAGVQVAEGQTARVSLRLPRGAAITGTIVDVDGLPAQGIGVRTFAYRYVGSQGERRYLAVGATVSASDDRGVYRIYGLPAGEYVVAAQPVNRQVGPGAAEVRTISRGTISDRGLILSQVFHPGATEVGRAARVTVGVGEERSGIDVQLQYVPLATISGIASAGPGWNPAFLTMARIDDVPGFDPPRTARADTDGRFTIPGVPPGQYRLIARSTAASPLTTSGSPLIVPPGNMLLGSLDVAVDGEDIGSLAVSLAPGLVVSGRLVFDGTRPAPPLPSLRVPVPLSTAIANFGSPFPPLVVEGGTFKAEGVAPGLYRPFGPQLQGVRTPIGAWWLKSLVVGGRDVLDAPLDLRQSVDDAVATFADQASEVSGTIKDAQGNPVTDQVLVVFSADRSMWFFNSRRVAGVRADAQGRYAIRNLPPGDYRIIVSADMDQGEWFDPTVLEKLLPAAGSITLTGVEKKTQDFMIRDRP